MTEENEFDETYAEYKVVGKKFLRQFGSMTGWFRSVSRSALVKFVSVDFSSDKNDSDLSVIKNGSLRSHRMAENPQYKSSTSQVYANEEFLKSQKQREMIQFSCLRLSFIIILSTARDPQMVCSTDSVLQKIAYPRYITKKSTRTKQGWNWSVDLWVQLLVLAQQLWYFI